MSDTMSDTTTSSLPDPTLYPGYYAGVMTKRFFAWLVDIALIALITSVFASLPLFLGWFFWPLLFALVSFAYRTITLSRSSATLGMRVFNIELRNNAAEKLESSEAVVHTVAYMISMTFFFPQLISVLMMLLNDRGQGLNDMLAGVTAINKPSRF